MKKEILLGIGAFSMLIASCGGESGEGNGTDTTATDTTPAVVWNEYTVDTAASVVNWKSYAKVGDTSKYHTGWLKLESGNITTTDSAGISTLTAGELTFDMASATEAAGATDLDMHLEGVDFFDVANHATSTFTFESFDGTNATGTLSIIGKTASISAPAVVTITPEQVTVVVDMFLVDFLALEVPFFTAETKLKADKQHDPKIEVTATIVANRN